MAKLTDEMKDFLAHNLCWITTISKDGTLNLGPKMSMFVLDDEHLAYHERTAGQHFANLSDGSDLVVACVNFEQKKGYRFRGNVVLHKDDEIYQTQVHNAEENGTKVPAVVPVLQITTIEDLSAGAKAGTTIA